MLLLCPLAMNIHRLTVAWRNPPSSHLPLGTRGLFDQNVFSLCYFSTHQTDIDRNPNDVVQIKWTIIHFRKSVTILLLRKKTTHEYVWVLLSSDMNYNSTKQWCHTLQCVLQMNSSSVWVSTVGHTKIHDVHLRVWRCVSDRSLSKAMRGRHSKPQRQVQVLETTLGFSHRGRKISTFISISYMYYNSYFRLMHQSFATVYTVYIIYICIKCIFSSPGVSTQELPACSKQLPKAFCFSA